MRRLLFLIVLSFSLNCYSQGTVWTLQDCITYALENNLTIKQSELDKKLLFIEQNSAKSSRYPSLSLSTSAGTSLGRSINPTTNQFENTQYTYTGISGGVSVLLFGWFQKKYAIEKSQLNLDKTNEIYEQLKDDIVLNISTAYLRGLLAKEEVANMKYQIDLSINNKNRIERLLNAGKSNVLELSQANTQLTVDSGMFLQAELNYKQSLYELKAMMNFDFETPMAISYSSTEDFNQKTVYIPEEVYQLALNTFHSVKSNEIAIQIAKKDIQIVKAGSLPSLNTYYSTGTNYSSSFYEYLPNGDRRLMNFGKQLNSNLSHSFGLGLSIPLFNNFTSRNSIKTAKIGLEKAYIANKEGLLKLKKDIYAACTDYQLAIQKYENANSQLFYAQTAFKAAEVRYEAGLIAYFEYLTEKNKFTIAQQQVSNFKYDLEFKKKLIERFIN
ncbi:transporter [Sphingobacterium faecium NBRC 15299]|uniref:TolC family protein n=1 Tax=Sphingobacterium faecium TaxID=34087 RepID=UPI000D374A1A|nr:TolC family protein [Sphingobacterium faecium]PTX09468.1 outer membrane protein [Sphingobacterium faecium]GEM63909.1 transporter [Sphingobacterium faecium NBRC 15299]